jgi:hypothetical protein
VDAALLDVDDARHLRALVAGRRRVHPLGGGVVIAKRMDSFEGGVIRRSAG